MTTISWTVNFLVITLLLLSTQGEEEEFQLVTKTGKCLQVAKNTGIIISCKDPDGNFTPNTVYYVSGAPGTYSIHIVGALGLCLDREHCHHSTSQLGYNVCDHCGAIHWNIVTGSGAVCEDTCKNCIYLQNNVTAAIHHCSAGFEAFNKTLVGSREKERFLLNIYYQRMYNMYKYTHNKGNEQS